MLANRPSKHMEGKMTLKQDLFDFDALLHPARAYEHPRDVVADDDLTLYEKRAILSSWASDACAVEDFPELREVSGVAAVKFDDIMDALRELDCELERRVHCAIEDRRKGSGSDHSGNIPLM
jgi:hypothetical protein